MNFDHIFNGLTGLCEIAIWWMIWQDYRVARGKPELRMPKSKWMLMVVLSLIPLGVLVYARETTSSTAHLEIPEFDEPQNRIYNFYGSANFGCYIDANGSALWDFQEKYRVSAGCIVFDGKTDLLDTPN